MEGIRFVDIYASKGIEYLIVIAFLAAFVMFASYLSRSARAAARVAPAQDMTRFRVPQGLFYHQGHSWLRPGPGPAGVVGLDDFAQKLVGRVDSLELPPVGTTLAQGAKGWSLVVDSVPIPMLSPVDGEVVEVNRDLEQSPETVNQSPHEAGWIAVIQLANPSETGSLLDAAAYEALIA